MPPIECTRSSNGSFTSLPNIADVAKSMKTELNFILHYFQYDIGCEVDCEKPVKTLRGIHDTEQLQCTLDKFVKKFVICMHPTCEDVGTTLRISGKGKRENVVMRCTACGTISSIVPTNRADTRMCSYIKKNLPKKEKSQKSKTAEGSLPMKGSPEEFPNDGSSSDEEFSTDTSPEAVAKRAAAEGIGLVAGIVACAEQELPQSDRLELFYKFVTKNKSSSHVKKIVAEATRLNCGSKAVLVLMDIFCISNTEFYTNPTLVLEGQTELLLCFLKGNQEIQQNLLSRLEKLCNTKESLIAKFLRIVVTLSGNHLIDKEVILKWYSTKPEGSVGVRIRKNTSSFIEWLEEDEEDSEEEEEDDTVVFSSEHIETVKSPVQKKTPEDTLEDSFIDDL